MTPIDYPWHFDGRGRTADTTSDEHIRDLIEQFLLTNAGERVNRPDFGSGLIQLVFAPNSPELATALEFAVQSGLQRHLGDLIELRALKVTYVDAGLVLEVQYLVRRTGEARSERIVRPL